MEKKAAPILAIESSCDETACAILDADGTVRADLVASQIAEHAPFGGVVPEIAARAHLAILPGMVTEALNRAGLTLPISARLPQPPDPA
jgi:N6-L-threonylcarbamoyladenine synthase